MSNSITLIDSSEIFAGWPVRDLFARIDYQASSIDNQVTAGLFTGPSKSVSNARRNSHLTHSTTSDHQIRYPLKDRIERSIRKLASDIATHCPSTIRVHLKPSDGLSNVFFNQLERLGISVQRTEQNSFQPAIENVMQDRERDVVLALRLLNPIEEVLKFAEERIYSGDYYTGYEVLIRIPSSHRYDSISFNLGLCCNFFQRTTESETHFNRCLESTSALTRISASYTIAMLYLRLHDKSLQDRSYAEKLLENAYADIARHPEIPDHTFHAVFNRNGYALCLYRRGQTEEALEMLKKGLRDLAHSAGSVAAPAARPLHRSVLIYNAVQCLMTLGRFNECESMCEELLAADPKFAEYRLEYARVLLTQGKISEALGHLKEAEEIDNRIPELHAIRGFAYLEQKDLKKAATAYAIACRLDPENAQFQNDLEYCEQTLQEMTV